MMSGTPDLLSSGLLSRRVASVSQALETTSQELTSGRQSDLVAASGGDPARLYTLERDIGLIDGRLSSLQLTAGRATIMQASLTQLRDALDPVGARLLAATTIDDFGSASRIADESRSAFEQAISGLNAQFGGRSLFAGAGVDGPATASADAILEEIFTLVAGAADAAAVVTIVDDYFTAPTGYAATGYAGSAADAPEVELAPGERLAYAPRADDQEIRDALSALALGVVGAEGGFAGDSQDARMEILGVAGGRGLEAVSGVISAQSTLGVTEERVEISITRAEAQRAVFGAAFNDIVQRDQFEAAAAFTAIETQLQSIFSITARLSQLNLTNFLR